MMAKHPTTVIFDIGNVLINWDMALVYRALFKDDSEMQKFFNETNLIAWNLEQDRGRDWHHAEEVLIAEHPQYVNEIKAFRTNWHDMVSGPITGSVELHQTLHKTNVPLYAITNFAEDTFKEAQHRFPFLTEFIDIVVSAEEKLIKPNVKIYHCLLQRNKLEASDCLFIDDSEANIVAAESIGMRVHHFSNPNALKISLLSHGFEV